MAADPFAALGLAGNIITLIDFTWKLFAGAHTIYHSHSGTSDENAVLEVIAHDISTLGSAIIVEQARSEKLRALAAESKRVAEELLHALEKLKTKGRNSRWESLKAALKEVWSRGEIENLEKSLSKLQAQVTAHVQHLMGNKMSEISVAVNRLTQTNNLLRLDMKRLATMDAMIKDILRATTALQFSDQNRRNSNEPMQALSLAVSNLGVHAQTIAHEQHLLGSLHFSMIQARHEKIEKAHANTYEWIFRDSGPDNAKPLRFAQWLETGNGIYWIHGKPGCGKSTLMKFICDHAQTRDHLSRWSQSHSKSLEERIPNTKDEERLRYEAELIKSYHQQQKKDEQGGKGEIAKLVTAKYFFWNAGSKLQKSQEGLLRSLVFEVLRQCPELVGHVRKARSRYRGFEDDLGETGSLVEEAPWSFEELISTVQDVINVRMSATFCLFIDGLDEYEEENKRTYRDLVDTLNRIAQFPNVKICASSRPWTVFSDAFKSRSMYSLKLEDLTRGDIRRFVSDTFQKHDQYRRLKNYDAGYNNLIDEVARRAQGVFLWVYLVVKDLLEGLTYNDSVQTMLKRLDQFPEDLEDFFQHMIESIPRQYRHQAARTFLVTMAAPEPLLLVLHSFLDDIEADPNFCLIRPQKPLDTAELTFRHERMRRQLEGRTKGLLEVVSGSKATEPYYQFKVDFLHRTVKDFLLSSSKVQSFMLNGQKDAFKTWVLVCRGILAEIKHSPFETNHKMRLEKRLTQNKTLVFVAPEHLNQLSSFLSDFVHFAGKALHGTDNESTVLGLFTALESANETAKARLNDDSDRLPELICEHGILKLLQQVDYDWSNLSLSNPRRTPLIRRALMYFKGVPQDQVAVVEYLLGRGANPNQRRMGNSHFHDYMVMLLDPKGMEGQEEQEGHSFRIVEALVAHGVDLSVLISPSGSPKLTAREAIRKLFPPELASRILESAPTGKWVTRKWGTEKKETEKREAEEREMDKRETDKREREALEALRREAEKREAEKREAEKREAEKREAEKGWQGQALATNWKRSVSPKLMEKKTSSTPSPGCGAVLWSSLRRILGRHN